MIKPGTYKAKIVSHAISETKSGDPQAAVTFSFDESGTSKTITWFGSFKQGKAQEITIKALLTCGLKGNNPAGDLEIGREVMIVIEDDTDEKGKTRTRVKWVNPLGGVKNVIPGDAARAKLDSLQAAVMSARADLGVPDSDDIPF